MDEKDERVLPVEVVPRSVEKGIRSVISSRRVNAIRGKTVHSNM